jgi:hypothetical protein
MRNFLGHLDIVSQLVILRTFVLFLAALFIKGFDHGLQLAAGVLPVKLPFPSRFWSAIKPPGYGQIENVI